MSISYDDRFWTSLREVFVYWAKKKLGTDVVQYKDTDGTVKTYNLNLFTSIREAVLALASSEDSSGGTGTIPVLPNGQYPSSLPPEGSVYLYVRADNKLYIYDSTGKETELSGSSSGTDIKGIYEADYYVNTLDTSKGEIDKKYLYKDTYGYAIYLYDGTQYNKILSISNLFIYITSSNDIYFLGESGTSIIEVYTKYLEPNVYEVSDILGSLPDNPLEGESYLILNGPYNYSIYQFINNEWVIKKQLITNGLIYNKKLKYYQVLDSRSGNVGINKILTSYEGENIDILKYFEELPPTDTGLSLNTLSYRWNGSALTFPFYLSYLWYSEATNTGKKFDDFLNLPLRTTDWVKFNGLWISNGAAPDYSGWNINPTVYSDYVQNAGTFIDGLSGTGFRLAKLSLYSSEYPVAITNYNLTIDNLTVRKGIRAYEYVVNLIKATNDSLWISSSCKLIKVDSIVENELEYYRCYVSTEEDKTDYYVPFKENAVIRCGASLKDPENTITKYYSGVVSSVVNNLEGNRYFDILKSSIEGTGIPEVNDEVVKIGNTLDVNDLGAIYLTSSDLYSPYIDILDGVNSPSFSNINPSTGKSISAVKVRLGNLNGIEDEAFNKYGGVKGYGAYIPNGYFKGTVIITSEGSDISIEDYVNNYVNKLIEDFETNVSSNTEFIESIREGLNLDLDNKVDVYYLGTDPSLDTIWGDPQSHKHDLWFDTTNKVLYCYNPIEGLQGNFWEKIEDLDVISAAQKAEDALNLADGKVTAFTGNNLPSPPYNIGDIWMQGTTGSILYTIIKRDKYKDDSVVPPVEWDLTIGSEDYNLLKSDWVSASKYNDDASIKDFIDTLYKPEEDGVVEIHYGTNFNGLDSPDKGYEWGIEGKDTKAQHEGDLWYYQALNDNNILEDYVFRYTVSTINSEYSWERVYDSNVIAALKAAKTAEDLADKKRRVFTNTPSVPYDAGDLWMNAPITYPDGTSGVGILVASVSKSLSELYSKDDWETTNDYVNLETFDEIKLRVLSIFNDNIVILSEKDSLAIIWRQIDSDLQNLILEATGRTKEEWESPAQPVNPGVGILITDDKVLALIKEPNIGSYRVLEYYMTIILDTSGDIDLSTIEDILNLGLTMTYLKILLIFLKYYEDYNILYLYIQDVKTGNYELFVSNTVSTILGLVDGKIDCYFSTTDPKDSWEYPYTEHDGDMWYKKTLDDTIGLLYTWDINIGIDGGWSEITDSNLVQIYDTASRSRDTIDLRRRIFYTTPTPPYDEGDMWVLGLDKDILRSIKSRSTNEVFNLEDWDTALNYSLTVSDISDILDKIININSQLDGKIDTWYMKLPPNLDGWPDGSDDSTHVGDLWLDTSLNSEGNPRNIIHIFTVEGEEPNLVYSWQEFTDPDILKALEDALKAQDTADGKRTIYIEQPVPPYQVGDMWVGRNNETDGSYLICIREKPIIDLETGEIINDEFDINDWEKIDDYPTYDNLPAVGINLISNLNSNWTFSSLPFGNRNLAINSDFSKGSEGWYMYNSSTHLTVEDNVATISSDKVEIIACSPIDIVAGEVYTVSAEVRSDNLTSLNYNYILGRDLGGSVNEGLTYNGPAVVKPSISSEWSKVAVTFIPRYTQKAGVGFGFNMPEVGAYSFQLRKFKLEKGNKATDWTPAPEDNINYIPGRNLILDSEKLPNSAPVINWNYNVPILSSQFKPNTDYVLSIGRSVSPLGLGIYKVLIYNFDTKKEYFLQRNIPIGDERQVINIKTPDDVTVSDERTCLLIYKGQNPYDENAEFYEVKLEEGNKATDWSPAPEDTNYSYSYSYLTSSKPEYFYTLSINSGFRVYINFYDEEVLLDTIGNITESVYTFLTPKNTNKIGIQVIKDSGFLIEDLRIKVEEGKKATVFTFSPEDIEAINDSIKDSINSIISDGILVPSEQSKLLLELLRINLEYWRIYNTILALIQYLDGIVADVIPGILDEITAFTDSYNSLINYSINSLKLLSINGELITSASSVIPTTITDLNIILSPEDLSIFTAIFNNYYELATKILDRIDRLMVDLSSSLDNIIKTTISNILGNNDNSKDWTWDDWALAATKEEGSATLILGGYIRTNLINAQALSITKEGNTVSFSSLFDLYSTINNKGNTLGDTLTDIFTDAIYDSETGTLIVNGYLKSDLIDANTLVIRDNDGLSLGTLINGGYIDTKFIKANELQVNGTSLDLYVDDKVYSGIEDLTTAIINDLVPNILGTYLVGTGNLLDISLMELGDILKNGLNNNNLTYSNITTRSTYATPIPSGVTKLYLSIDLNHIMAIWFYDWDGNTVGPTDPYVLFTKKEETLEVPSTAKFFRVLIRKLGATNSDTLTSYLSILAGATPMVWAGSMKPSSYVENTWTDDLLADKKNKVIGENDSIIRYLQYIGYSTLGLGYINDDGEIISYSTNYYTYTRLYKLDNVEKIIYLFYSDDSGNNIYFYDKDLLPIKNSYIGRLEISNGVLTTFPPNAKYVRFHLKFGGLVSKGINVGYLAIVYKDLPPLENLLPYSPGYYEKGNHYNGEAGNDTYNTFYSFIPEYKIPIEEGEMLQFINFLGYSYKEGYSSIITTFYKDGVWVKNGTLNKDTPAVICDGTYNLVCVSVAIISYTNGGYNWTANLFLYQVEDKIKDKLMIVKGTTRPNKWTPCPLDLQDINEDCPNIFSNLLLLIGGSYIGEEQNRADRATLKVSYIPVGNNRFIGLNNDGVYKISGLFYNSANQYIAGTDITLNEGIRVPDKIVVRIPSNAAYFRPVISRMDNGNIDISHVRQNARCMAKFSSLIPTRYIPNENDVIKGTYNILPLNSGEWRRGRLDPITGAYQAPSGTWTYANCNICTYKKVKVKPSTTYIFKGDYTNDDLYAIRFFVLSFNLSGQFISRATHEYYENGETFLTDSSTYYILPLILISLKNSNYELLPSIITSNKFILLEGNTINDSAYNNPYIAANPNLAPNTNQGIKNWTFSTDTGTYTLTNHIVNRGNGWSVGGVKGIKLSLTKLGSYNSLLYKLDINKFVPYLTVTLSMMIYSDKSFTTNAYIQTPNASYLWHDLAFSIRTTANQWEFIERTVILKSTVPSIDTACYLNIYTPYIATIYIANLKIEEGPVATSYSLSESDLDYNLDEISSSLGYNDFADMVNYAKSGNTLVQGGYIRANMIHIVDPGTGTSGALLTSDGYIYGKYILAKSITANKIDIEDLVASSAFINSLSGTSLNFTKGKIGPLTITENYLGVASGSSAAGLPCVSIGSRYFAVFGGTQYYFRVDADSGGNLGIFLVSMLGNGSLATPLLRINNWNISTSTGEAMNVLGKLYFKGGTVLNSHNSDTLSVNGYGLNIQSTGFKVSITNNKANPPTSSSSNRVVGSLCCDSSVSGLWKPVYIYIGS